MAPTLSAAILAGGQASRLGGLDKSALVIDGRSILERELAAVRALTTDICIVANDPNRYEHAGVTIRPDLIPGAGALGGLYTAVASASTPLVLALACDMPFLTPAFLAHLVSRAESADVVIPHDSAGRHVLCGVFAAGVASHLRSAVEAGRLRVGDALAGLRVRVVGPDETAPFDPAGRLLLNVNTPADLARATAP
jgi:molybdopterin-guanine dinucleotide biosynthesis protein A